ncbi:MAG: NAD(+)/NADH kinase [Candidatus Omnitrophica bacterium]|nr:NAD(+)/NADH kinase [Candidatus Omnitrophota bacterium]
MGIRKVGIVVNPKKDDAIKVLRALTGWLEARKIEVINDLSIPRDRIPSIVDLIIVLGGDGTLLNVARFVRKRAVPILGVNLGGLGFLTEVTIAELYGSLKEILKGNYKISERAMLKTTVTKRGRVMGEYFALNDIVVAKGALSRIVTLRLLIDGEFITSYMCDGLIVSTSTGSTAHSLSAGGPIVYPALESVVITPICPHTLSNRPLIIDNKSRIGISIAKGNESQEVALTVDGQVGLKLDSDDAVDVVKSPYKVRLIGSTGRSYFQILREKLGWGRGRCP